MAFGKVLVAMILITISVSINRCDSYERPKARRNLASLKSTLKSDDPTPQQVHISQVGPDKMRVTWVTGADAPSTVDYGTASGQYPFSSSGISSTYRVVLYKSGFIHDVIIGPLQPNTIYYYRCSGNTGREFSFKTTPSQLPIKFAVIGDLGQTEWTNSTLSHITSYEHDMLILPGDLAYADLLQPLWDSFGNLVEPLASKRPWMVTQGNHEVEKIPIILKPFTAYNARWTMPYEISGSGSNLYYSFDVAGSIHVLMLGSYADYGPGSDQYNWLVADLAKVDRTKVKWLIAVIHAPWYNSNEAHQGEGEDMRKAMEELLYTARVDIVFAGHVHAYERFARVHNNEKDECGPMYINIGDGGNKEGLAKDYIQPAPSISIFREASFGHGRLEVMNGTHALWTWHRNDDDQAVAADQVWITSLPSSNACNSFKKKIHRN